MAALYLSACQKDFTIENTTQSIVDSAAVLDSNYLDKIIYTTTVGNLTDTDFIQIYNYDAQKRVVSLVDSIKTVSGIIENYTVKYSYNGNDSLPNKKFEIYTLISPSIINKDTIITFYNYSLAGLKLKDSALRFFHKISTSSGNYDEFSKEITTYQYVVNKISGKTTNTTLYNTFNTNVGIPYSTFDTATFDIAGNLIRNERSDSLNQLFRTSTFTYDNKPNPFARLSNYKTLEVFPSGETFIDEMQAKNNRLHAVEGNLPFISYDDDLTGKYEYKTNGYPKQIIETDGIRINKTIFIYKSL